MWYLRSGVIGAVALFAVPLASAGEALTAQAAAEFKRGIIDGCREQGIRAGQTLAQVDATCDCIRTVLDTQVTSDQLAQFAYVLSQGGGVSDAEVSRGLAEKLRACRAGRAAP